MLPNFMLLIYCSNIPRTRNKMACGSLRLRKRCRMITQADMKIKKTSDKPRECIKIQNIKKEKIGEKEIRVKVFFF